MESSHLELFIKSVVAWPRTPAELHRVAHELKQLLKVPVVLIWIPELGAKVVGPDTYNSYKESALIELVRSQGPLPGEFVSKIAVLWSPAHKEYGRILVGSENALTPGSKILLRAAKNHLTHLAEVQGLKLELAMRDQFLSIASHELKTPLTSIYGILQLQDRMLKPKPGTFSTPEQEKQRSFFKIVIRQVERLNELIDGLLDVSRIQNGRFIVEPSETDVAVIIRETVEGRLNVIASEAGVKINVEVPISLKATVDPVRFEEVITNLVMNAIRFSPEGGVVWVRLKEMDDSFVVSIRDQGPSIPGSDRERVFHPFEQAERTTRLGGLGLGLFISRQIAQLHHGNVTLAEGTPGRGNVLEARFPLMNRSSQEISA